MPAKAIQMGLTHLVDIAAEILPDDEVQGIKYGLVIAFDDAEELREAVQSGHVEFTFG